MNQNNAAQLFKVVRQDQALKAQLRAAADPDTFMRIAKENGYSFTIAELEAEISQLSPEEVAAVVNPGVAPRRHIHPR
jgi:predicted ribosomally synthesized peptide with nif11-like leader